MSGSQESIRNIQVCISILSVGLYVAHKPATREAVAQRPATREAGTLGFGCGGVGGGVGGGAGVALVLALVLVLVVLVAVVVAPLLADARARKPPRFATRTWKNT